MINASPTTPEEAIARDERNAARLNEVIRRALAEMITSGVVVKELVIVAPHHYGPNPLALHAEVFSTTIRSEP